MKLIFELKKNFQTEGTTGIIEGLYHTALNQKQQIRNYHTSSRAEDSSKNTAGLKPSSLIYAVFTTPQNAIPGSAVCAFQIDDIIDTFEGKFKIPYKLEAIMI